MQKNEILKPTFLQNALHKIGIFVIIFLNLPTILTGNQRQKQRHLRINNLFYATLSLKTIFI